MTSDAEHEDEREEEPQMKTDERQMKQFLSVFHLPFICGNSPALYLGLYASVAQ